MDKTLDMTRGPIGRQMLTFAFPVFLSALMQQMYFIADTLIISNLLGDKALAAVTNCENLAYFITAFIFGIGMGIGVVISQAFGAKEYAWMRRVEGTGIASAFFVSLIMIVIGLAFTRPVLQIMQTPADVMEMSASYLTVYICGCGGNFIFNACAGMRQAAGDTKTPLYFLIFACICNIAMDLTFILVFHMGVAGAALATVIAELLSGILMIVYLTKVKDEQRITYSQIRVSKEALKEICRMGFPGALESSATSLANAMIQGFTNTFGSSVMAATGAFATIDGFGFLPITAFCQALGTFTGQNVGALQEERTRKGCRFALFWLVVGCFAIGIVILLFCKPLMGLFTDSEQTIQYALTKARYTCLMYPMLGLTHCFSAMFRGAGKPVIPMIAYLGSWGVIRVTILMLLMPVHHDYAILCWVYPVTWTISTIFLAACYKWYPWFPKKEPTMPAMLQES